LKRAQIIDQHAAFSLMGMCSVFPSGPRTITSRLATTVTYLVRRSSTHHHGQGRKILAAGEIEEQRMVRITLSLSGRNGKTDAAGRMVKRDQRAVHAIRCLENAADLRAIFADKVLNRVFGGASMG
jgi:hypothetical protein